ncbi:unnamed protein product [Nezara viridula]|uniref:Uncharacterized protein n=1 Tax=Nezara viridula TaxID=85310 RepID=A0A9P0EIM5_NEZVI|nr:unnamed protein product [Nezara viridula]
MYSARGFIRWTCWHVTQDGEEQQIPRQGISGEQQVLTRGHDVCEQEHNNAEQQEGEIQGLHELTRGQGPQSQSGITGQGGQVQGPGKQIPQVGLQHGAHKPQQHGKELGHFAGIHIPHFDDWRQQAGLGCRIQSGFLDKGHLGVAQQGQGFGANGQRGPASTLGTSGQ